MLTKKSKIFLAGHNGMVGSAILNKLKKKDSKILNIEIATNSICLIKKK